MKIAIIWGTSGFGKWLAKYIKDNFENVDIVVTWRNLEKWKLVAKELWVKFTDDNIKAVENADITIFSVPISKMEDTIKQVAPYVKPWSIVADVCSIKWFPAKVMKEYSPKNTLIIPVHPMFWPYVSSIADQIFVLTPDEEVKSDKRYKFFKDFLQSKWAKIIETTPQEHDKMMAIVQWLTHISMFMVWEAISRLNVDVKKTFDFVSPIYKLLIASVLRYIWHDPKLYGDIQMFNPEVLKVHEVLVDVMTDFNKAVLEKDEDKFITIINHSKQKIGKYSDFWQKYTDKIIYFMSKQKEKLQNSIWKEIVLENIYTWKIVKWVLRKLVDDEIVLENGKKFYIYEWILWGQKR